MVEIIKRGCDKVYKACCPRCDSDIKYSKSDRRIGASKYDDKYYYVVCPECTNYINLGMVLDNED